MGEPMAPQEGCPKGDMPPGCPCPDPQCPKKTPFDYFMRDVPENVSFKDEEELKRWKTYMKNMECELKFPTYKDVGKTYINKQGYKCPCPQCVTAEQKAWAEVEKFNVGPPPECPCVDPKCPRKAVTAKEGGEAGIDEEIVEEEEEEIDQDDEGSSMGCGSRKSCLLKGPYPKQSGCELISRCDLICAPCGPHKPSERFKCGPCSLLKPMPPQSECPDYNCRGCRLVCHPCGCPPEVCDKCKEKRNNPSAQFQPLPESELDEEEEAASPCPPCSIPGPYPKQTDCDIDEKDYPCVCDPATGNPINMSKRLGPCSKKYHDYMPIQTFCPNRGTPCEDITDQEELKKCMAQAEQGAAKLSLVENPEAPPQSEAPPPPEAPPQSEAPPQPEAPKKEEDEVMKLFDYDYTQFQAENELLASAKLEFVFDDSDESEYMPSESDIPPKEKKQLDEKKSDRNDSNEFVYIPSRNIVSVEPTESNQFVFVPNQDISPSNISENAHDASTAVDVDSAVASLANRKENDVPEKRLVLETVRNFAPKIKETADLASGKISLGKTGEKLAKEKTVEKENTTAGESGPSQMLAVEEARESSSIQASFENSAGKVVAAEHFAVARGSANTVTENTESVVEKKEKESSAIMLVEAEPEAASKTALEVTVNVARESISTQAALEKSSGKLDAAEHFAVARGSADTVPENLEPVERKEKIESSAIKVAAENAAREAEEAAKEARESTLTQKASVEKSSGKVVTADPLTRNIEPVAEKKENVDSSVIKMAAAKASIEAEAAAKEARESSTQKASVEKSSGKVAAVEHFAVARGCADTLAGNTAPVVEKKEQFESSENAAAAKAALEASTPELVSETTESVSSEKKTVTMPVKSSEKSLKSRNSQRTSATKAASPSTSPTTRSEASTLDLKMAILPTMATPAMEPSTKKAPTNKTTTTPEKVTPSTPETTPSVPENKMLSTPSSMILSTLASEYNLEGIDTEEMEELINTLKKIQVKLHPRSLDLVKRDVAKSTESSATEVPERATSKSTKSESATGTDKVVGSPDTGCGDASSIVKGKRKVHFENALDVEALEANSKTASIVISSGMEATEVQDNNNSNSSSSWQMESSEMDESKNTSGGFFGALSYFVPGFMRPKMKCVLPEKTVSNENVQTKEACGPLFEAARSLIAAPKPVADSSSRAQSGLNAVLELPTLIDFKKTGIYHRSSRMMMNLGAFNVGERVR